jgi:hypothetical protein
MIIHMVVEKVETQLVCLIQKLLGVNQRWAGKLERINELIVGFYVMCMV